MSVFDLAAEIGLTAQELGIQKPENTAQETPVKIWAIRKAPLFVCRFQYSTEADGMTVFEEALFGTFDTEKEAQAFLDSWHPEDATVDESFVEVLNRVYEVETFDMGELEEGVRDEPIDPDDTYTEGVES